MKWVHISFTSGSVWWVWSSRRSSCSRLDLRPRRKLCGYQIDVFIILKINIKSEIGSFLQHTYTNRSMERAWPPPHPLTHYRWRQLILFKEIHLNKETSSCSLCSKSASPWEIREKNPEIFDLIFFRRTIIPFLTQPEWWLIWDVIGHVTHLSSLPPNSKFSLHCTSPSYKVPH